ncbi:MAG: LysR family transcriptional regulator [Clostridiales Family XIII bacterium]|jgi:DNA-binding transcriptional LysR family regulator|nr:LysR family transcriptional regulator [Clostridiales Family XIII bacterium]
MDILKIKSFLAVVNTGNFSEAGALLHTSQSSISKNIFSLENDLGIELLNRSGKHFSVSDAGRRVMPYFIEITKSFDLATQSVADLKREIAAGARTSFKIAGIPVLGRYNVISLIGAFSKMHPDIRINITEHEEDHVLLALQSDDCDIAFCSDIALSSKYCNTKEVCSEEFMLAVSPKNRFAARTSVNIRELESEYFILNRHESMLYDVCVNACIRSGFVPKIVMTTTRPNIALEYVCNNDKYVCMWLKKSLEDNQSDACRNILIEDSPKFNLVFAWKQNKVLPESAGVFLEFADSYLPLKH